jgi:hypothetical protein
MLMPRDMELRALEFMDGCSHLGTGTTPFNTDRKWTSASPLGSYYLTTPVRRSNPSFAAPACCLYLNSSFPTKTLTYQASRYMGGAYFLSASNPQVDQFLRMLSGGTTIAFLTVEADQTVSIYAAGNSTPIFNSAPYAFSLNAYHYVEFYVSLGGGTPITVTASLKIDGNALATNVTGNSGINASSLLCGTAEMNQIGFNGDIAYVMDVIVMNSLATDVNGNATTLNGFQGDVAIMDLVPDANVTTGWTLVGGSTQYGVLANIPPQDDVEYISSDTVSQVSSVNMTPISGITGTLLCAQLCVYCKKDAEGSRAIRALLNSTVVKNWTGPTSTPISDQYLYDYYDYFLFPLDSDLGTPWTETNFNAAAFGVEVSV